MQGEQAGINNYMFGEEHIIYEQLSIWKTDRKQAVSAF